MSDDTPPHETLDALQTRHRKEQRDLVARTTQKKKAANKKTRKGVNEECERLERELKERQDAEVAALNGDGAPEQAESESDDDDDAENAQDGVANLNITTTQTPPGPVPSQPPNATTKKPNRAKSRLARRAAEQASLIAAAEAEAANAPDPRALERTAMSIQLEKHQLALHEIRADGHCLYAAVADQLVTREVGLAPRISIPVAGQEGYKTVRHAAASWIESHANDFAGFTEDPLPEHVRKVRETGEWGGHLELQALARAYGVKVCVLHSDGRVDRFEGEEKEGKEVEEVWLGYFKHSHGLGEHYNSLRKIKS